MTSATKSACTHTVEVGKTDYSITPDVVQAEVGDFIRYQFYPGNHSIARAAYGYPCVPYELVYSGDKPGFFSGYRPVNDVFHDPPSFTVRVNDTDPIFVYCTSPKACIQHGMVAVVNPNITTSLERQRQLAHNSDFVIAPGDSWPAEANQKPQTYTRTTTVPSRPQTVTLHPSTASSLIYSTSSISTGVAEPGVTQSQYELTSETIAGIVIGAVALLLLAAAAAWICGRRSGSICSSEEGHTCSCCSKKRLLNSTFKGGTTISATNPPPYKYRGIPTVTKDAWSEA